jgi:hypothetical protein
MDVCVHICIIRALLCVVVHYLSVGWSILNFTLRFGDLQAEFFKRFQAAHPNIIVQQRAFLKLKPYFVKPLLERNVCCCVYHVEVDLLRQGLNKMRNIRLGIHANNHAFFFCDICHPPGSTGLDDCLAHLKTFDGVTALWTTCVCPKAEHELWHAKACLRGECPACGVEKKLIFCPEELDPDSEKRVTWQCFEKTIIAGTDEEGQPRKRIWDVYKETAPFELVTRLKPVLQKFILHNFTARWQDAQARVAMTTMPGDVLLSHLDFAENYSFEVQNEIQSMYYHTFSVTILVHITHRMLEDELTGEERMLKETHYYISDDRAHDTLFVQHCLLEHWKWLHAQGFSLVEHSIFSDGCAGQFKGRQGMYFVARYPGLTEGCHMRWNYFGTAHGKGEDPILILRPFMLYYVCNVFYSRF